MASDSKYAENLRWQRSANRETWEVLLQNGLTSEMEVRVDFTYYSPTKKKASNLKLLLEEYEYEVIVNQFNRALNGLLKEKLMKRL